MQLGLIDIGYHNYVAAVIQNMTEKEIILKKGTAVAQLLLTKAKIPQFIDDGRKQTLHAEDSDLQDKILKKQPPTI